LQAAFAHDRQQRLVFSAIVLTGNIMKPLLLIKTGGTIPQLVPVHGDFERWFAAGLGYQPILQADVHQGAQLPDPRTVCGVVITGSAAMVSHREDWSEATGNWLLGALECALPILGVCYGHQLLAHALGGLVGPNPQGREIGTVEVTLEGGFEEDQLFSGYPESFMAQTTHSESVIELPTGATRLGRTDLDGNHVAWFSENAWGVQYHPEFSATVMREYIRIRSKELRDEGLDPDLLLSQVQDTPRAAGVLTDFVTRFLAEVAA
jgi:GMP synthase (glutamine-hydrolysing)